MIYRGYTCAILWQPGGWSASLDCLRVGGTCRTHQGLSLVAAAKLCKHVSANDLKKFVSKCFSCFQTLGHRLHGSYEPMRNRESSLWHLESIFPGTQLRLMRPFIQLLHPTTGSSDFDRICQIATMLMCEAQCIQLLVPCRVLIPQSPTWTLDAWSSARLMFCPFLSNCYHSYDRLEGKWLPAEVISCACWGVRWCDASDAGGTKYLSRS